MISFLSIKNFALLESAQIDFSTGFTAITGETGAGKSVILGALAMLAGNKFGKEAIKSSAASCKVEASLNFNDSKKIDTLLIEMGLPECENGELIISRSIFRDKAQRCFVNGSICTLANLVQISELWIDFHGPGEPQKLFKTKNQIDMLDIFASNDSDVFQYRLLYKDYRKVLNDIDELLNAKKLTDDEIDFLKNKISQIEKFNPTNDSIAELESKFKIVENASDIFEKSSAIYNLIQDENSLGDIASKAYRLSCDIADVNELSASLSERLNVISVELSDIAESYLELSENSSIAPDEIEAVRNKMNLWLGLTRKYGNSVDSVLEACKEMKHKLAMQGDVEAYSIKLKEKLDSLKSQMNVIAKKIFKARSKSASKLSKSVVSLLENLGFKNPRFEIFLNETTEPDQNCQSICEFLFSANAGQDILPLTKIASSGELARVMLAIKTTLASADSTPLLVFDEVDANVGGEIGANVGAELAKLSSEHQVICVTHLPQVAACANNHFLIEKIQRDSSTFVEISLLENFDSRVLELARMLGSRTSDSAKLHARKLLEANLKNG